MKSSVAETVDQHRESASAPPSIVSLPESGEVIDGKYEIRKLIGEGGMGVVYEALHVRLGYPVALKFVHPEALSAPGAIARFEREAKAARELRGAHVARVFDVSRTSEGLPYMAMERLRGRDLEAELRVRGALPIAEAVDIVIQACSAMTEAHEAGIVHRDIKPSNIFLSFAPDGSRVAKVLDFGVSLLTTSMSPRVTATAMSVGTPMYMSPEQVRCAKQVDHRTDVWALGVVLFEALVGKPPFEGTSTAAVAAIVADETPSVREPRPEVPAALDGVIARALAKDLPDRFQSAEELACALAPFGSGRVRRKTRVRLDDLARNWIAWAPAKKAIAGGTKELARSLGLRGGRAGRARFAIALGACFLVIPAMTFARFGRDSVAKETSNLRCIDPRFHTNGSAEISGDGMHTQSGLPKAPEPTPAESLTLGRIAVDAPVLDAIDGGAKHPRAREELRATSPVSTAKPIRAPAPSTLGEDPLYL